MGVVQFAARLVVQALQRLDGVLEYGHQLLREVVVAQRLVGVLLDQWAHLVEQGADGDDETGSRLGVPQHFVDGVLHGPLVLPLLAGGCLTPPLLGLLGFTGVLTALLGLLPQRPGGDVQCLRGLVCDIVRDDERDLALVHELGGGADDVDDDGMVAARLDVGLFEERPHALGPDIALLQLGAAQRIVERGAWLHPNQTPPGLAVSATATSMTHGMPSSSTISADLYQRSRTPYPLSMRVRWSFPTGPSRRGSVGLA